MDAGLAEPPLPTTVTDTSTSTATTTTSTTATAIGESSIEASASGEIDNLNDVIINIHVPIHNYDDNDASTTVLCNDDCTI